MTIVSVHQNGGDWTVTWHGPDDEPVGKAHGATAICFTPDGGLVVVSAEEQHWGLPGGRTEPGETWDQTMRREVWEEACATVTDARMLGFIHAVCHSGHEEGLVLVRSQWRAEVELGDWKPEFEVSHRRVVPVSEWRDNISMDDARWMPIFERFFAEAELK
jgi:ADP-ribose pyrophosphatase YjhB (NUDIX family)